MAGKIGGGTDPASLQVQFVDDEGDAIVVTSDADLLEAVNLARGTGNQLVKLSASEVSAKLDVLDPMVLAGIGACVAVAGLFAMIAVRPKR